jgi:CheY-like chemotaxis protein
MSSLNTFAVIAIIGTPFGRSDNSPRVSPLVKLEAIEEELRSSSIALSFTEGETQSYNRNLHKKIPIIAMTANVFKEDIENCLAAGMNDHLGKPIDIDIMVAKLRKYLRL